MGIPLGLLVLGRRRVASMGIPMRLPVLGRRREAGYGPGWLQNYVQDGRFSSVPGRYQCQYSSITTLQNFCKHLEKTSCEKQVYHTHKLFHFALHPLCTPPLNLAQKKNRRNLTNRCYVLVQYSIEHSLTSKNFPLFRLSKVQQFSEVNGPIIDSQMGEKLPVQ